MSIELVLADSLCGESSNFIQKLKLSKARLVRQLTICVEILQYFQLVDRLGLQNNRIAQIVIGATFDWMDLVAYATGTAIVIAVENHHRST